MSGPCSPRWAGAARVGATVRWVVAFPLLVGALLKVVGIEQSGAAIRLMVGRPDLDLAHFYGLVVLLAIAESVIAIVLLQGDSAKAGLVIIVLGASLYLAYIAMRCQDGAVVQGCPCFGGFLFPRTSCLAEALKASILLAVAGLGLALESRAGSSALQPSSRPRRR